MKNIISNLGYSRHKNILVEEYKTIYFHIPKNGCTSFKKHLFQYVGDKEYTGSIHKYDFPYSTSQQLKSVYNDYMKFTIVRNPWSRLVSCYKSKIRSSDFTNDYFTKGIHIGFKRYKGLFYGEMPFKEFAKAICSIPDSIADPHFVSQLFLLTDNTGKLRPNYIGRIENLNLSYDEISHKTGLSFEGLRVRNRSSYNTSYTSFYDVELKEKVRQRYAGDAEIFDYDFDSNAGHIGLVNNERHNKLAQSEFVIPILKEKCKHLEIKFEKALDLKMKTSLQQTLQETRKNLNDMQNHSKSISSRFLNFFAPKNILFKK